MKMLRFLLYVLKNGTLKNSVVDFEGNRKKILSAISIHINYKETRYIKLRTKLALKPFIGPLLSSLAYMKSVRRINRNFFFVDSLQLGYVRMLKCASTTVMRSILPVIDSTLKTLMLSDKEVDTLSWHYAKHEIKEQQRHQLFTVVRNPFSRLVSVYLDLFDSNNPHFPYEGHLFGILKHKMSFVEFVNTLSEIPNELMAPHFISQYQIIQACGGFGRIKIFRLEKDFVELTDFLHSYSLEINYSNRNKSVYDYKSYYTADTLYKVYDIYKNDVEQFGYLADFKALQEYIKEY